MGEAKRRKKLDPNWGKPKLLSIDDAQVATIPEKLERYRVISVKGFLKIASVSEIESEGNCYDYPPDWLTRYEFEGTLNQCRAWIDEYMAETGQLGILV